MFRGQGLRVFRISGFQVYILFTHLRMFTVFRVFREFVVCFKF